MPKILLVEDNELNRDMLARRLTRRGYDVVLAVDGQQGVEKARAEAPDLVLMDMSLPVMDGWTATRQIKEGEDTKSIPVVALTAHAMAGDREKALDAGCDDYDTKPVDFRRLMDKIQSWIESRPEQPQSAHVDQRPKSADATSEEASVLIVDDEEMNRDMLQRRLERRGYKITTAEDGRQALALLEKERFDLVLLDVMMPGMNGIDVLEILRKKHSLTELPVIMTTALTDSEEVVKALDAGANDYVTKPIDLPVVLARIKTQLSVRRQAVVEVDSTTPPTVTVSMSAAGPKDLVGLVLGEKYKLEEVLGIGGFGTVYRATHVVLGQAVAVKVLQINLRSTSQDLKRFQREAAAACRLKHPHAVRVIDIDVTSSGLPYFVMELLEGRTVEAELKERRVLSPERCAEILFPICDLLTEAHEASLVHRDLKPSNIFLHQPGRGEVVKVVDFGLAKVVDESAGADGQNLTVTDQVLGTPAYMAPERLNNQPYDGRSDVYSLGITTYQMLVGRVPFQSPDGNRMAVAMMQTTQMPTPLREVNPDVPAEVEATVLRALEKDPERRPSAREFAQDYSRAIGATIDPAHYRHLVGESRD